MNSRALTCLSNWPATFRRFAISDAHPTLAVEALLEEARLGARRAEIMGPAGWIKPKESVNKRFLQATLQNVIHSNKHHTLKKGTVVHEESFKMGGEKKH